MDAESLAQIAQIVTTAVSGAEGRLRQEFGEKTDALAASLRQEFGEKFEEARRHRGVLYEDVLHRIDLVVEGHQALFQKTENVEARLEGKIDHESLEMQSLMKLSYRQLQDRVETLEQRVQGIEKHLGLSA